jgi:hypothetical protein
MDFPTSKSHIKKEVIGLGMWLGGKALAYLGSISNTVQQKKKKKGRKERGREKRREE